MAVCRIGTRAEAKRRGSSPTRASCGSARMAVLRTRYSAFAERVERVEGDSGLEKGTRTRHGTGAGSRPLQSARLDVDRALHRADDALRRRLLPAPPEKGGRAFSGRDRE